jgi:hypothetical protein
MQEANNVLLLVKVVMRMRGRISLVYTMQSVYQWSIVPLSAVLIPTVNGPVFQAEGVSLAVSGTSQIHEVTGSKT